MNRNEDTRHAADLAIYRTGKMPADVIRNIKAFARELADRSDNVRSALDEFATALGNLDDACQEFDSSRGELDEAVQGVCEDINEAADSGHEDGSLTSEQYKALITWSGNLEEAGIGSLIEFDTAPYEVGDLDPIEFDHSEVGQLLEGAEMPPAPAPLSPADALRLSIVNRLRRFIGLPALTSLPE